MQIVLSKESAVPVRQQLAEHIVFLITTGQLDAGTELPSVRALGRQCGVHHNTVSDAYQELVRRGWLTRRPGSRLVVGKGHGKPKLTTNDLDDLINYSIQRARQMGFDLQAYGSESASGSWRSPRIISWSLKRKLGCERSCGKRLSKV